MKFKATASHLTTLLKVLHFTKRKEIQPTLLMIQQNGLRFIIEKHKSMIGRAYVRQDFFESFEATGSADIGIELSSLIEVLSVFGANATVTVKYQSTRQKLDVEFRASLFLSQTITFFVYEIFSLFSVQYGESTITANSQFSVKDCVRMHYLLYNLTTIRLCVLAKPRLQVNHHLFSIILFILSIENPRSCLFIIYLQYITLIYPLFD